MSHHSHLPPEVDEAVRSFIWRHKRGLRWGCLVGVLLALLLGLAAVWGIFRGAVRVKDWVAGNAPAFRLPLEWERPMGDAALAQLRGGKIVEVKQKTKKGRVVFHADVLTNGKDWEIDVVADGTLLKNRGDK